MTDKSRADELDGKSWAQPRWVWIEDAKRIIRELESRIIELEADRDRWQLSAEMACQNPPDGCDCCGCRYAAEIHSTKGTDS